MTHTLDHIHLGDCIPVMQSFPAQNVNLIVTDPPYLVNYRDRTGRSLAGDVTSEWLEPSFAEMYRVLQSDSFAISFYGWNHADKFISAWRKVGFRIVGHFVFVKHYASKTGYAEFRHECAYLLAKGTPARPQTILPDVMPWGKYTSNTLHPTQKPLEILRPLIKSYSRTHDVVLDPFAGSGSTLLAARQMHRSWIGIEIDQNYHHNATARIMKHSGETL